MSAEQPLVLYVDDEWENRVVFEKGFSRSFRVRAVPNGAAALEILKEETVGVVVADQRMPGMSGNELLERVKASWPGVMRIIVTAYSDLEPILRAVNEGLVHRYVVKPWDRSDLETILAWAVEAYLLGKEQSHLQLRLLAAERLITIGSIASSVFHDMGQAVGSAGSNVTRLAQHAETARVLEGIVRADAAALPEPHRTRLLELLRELPMIHSEIREDVERIDGLRSSMRRLLKPSAEDGQRVVENPVTIIEFVVRVFRQMAHANLRVFYDGPERFPAVRIGTTELYQVLINLVQNAVQAFPPPPEPGSTVSIHVADEPAVLRFVVKDNGAGMTPEVAKSAGVLFYSTKKDGAGLGLANCKRIVGGRRGELTLESAPGAGTRAIFTLPKA